MGKILKITSSQFNMILENRINKNIINEVLSDQTDSVSANISNNMIYLNFKIDDKAGSYVINNIYQKLRKNTKNGGYFLTAPASAVDSFLGGIVVNKIFDFLTQNNYKVPTVSQLKVQIEEKLKDVVTPADKAEATAKYNDLVSRILQNLNDPEIKRLASEISRFRIHPDVNDDIFGHVRSPRNALRVLATKPDATYVATRSKWLELFNREVKPNAQKIVVLRSAGGGGFDQSKAEKSLGITKDMAYQSPHMKHKFDIMAQGDDGGTAFIPYVVYDISDTVLIPGLDNNDNDLNSFDPFVDRMGLIDNIKGILNQTAIDFKGAKLSPEDKAKINVRDTSDRNLEVFSKVVNYMTDLSKGTGDLKNITDQLKNIADKSDDMSVLKVIKSYFSNIAFARASHDNDAKTNIATAGILAMTEVAPTALAYLIKSNESALLSFTKEELVPVFSQVLALDKIITARNVLDTAKGITNESGELNERSLNSVEDLVGLFGHTINDLKDGDNDGEDNNTDAIMNEFYNVYNKINNTINEYSNFRRKK